VAEPLADGERARWAVDPVRSGRTRPPWRWTLITGRAGRSARQPT